MGSRLLQDIKQQARAGLWRPFSDHARQFAEQVVEHFFDLPIGVESEYLRIVFRCIEAAPERCIQTFDPLEVMQLSQYDRRESADLACGAIGLYGFAPRELQGFRTRLTALSTDESLSEHERRAHEVCRIRFMHFCTWVEVYHQKELALRTSVGTLVAPAEQPDRAMVRFLPTKPKTKLHLVPKL